MIEVLVMGVGLTLDQATFDALRRAVEKETKVLIQTTTILRNGILVDDVILTKSSGYVSHYEVQDQRNQDGKVVVKVYAQVDQGKLEKDLRILLSKPAESLTLDGPLLAGKLQKKINDQRTLEEEVRQGYEWVKRFKADPTCGKTIPLKVSRDSNDEFSICVKAEVDNWADYYSADLGNTTQGITLVFKSREGVVLQRKQVRLSWYALVWNQSKVKLDFDPETLARIHTVVAVWD